MCKDLVITKKELQHGWRSLKTGPTFSIPSKSFPIVNNPSLLRRLGSSCNPFPTPPSPSPRKGGRQQSITIPVYSFFFEVFQAHQKMTWKILHVAQVWKQAVVTLNTHPKAGCFWHVTRWVPIPKESKEWPWNSEETKEMEKTSNVSEYGRKRKYLYVSLCLWLRLHYAEDYARDIWKPKKLQ